MATVNIYDMADTWNDVGTTFTAIKMDVTDTASASGSLLMDLLVDSSTVFSISAAGNISLGADVAAPGTRTLSMPSVTGVPDTAGANLTIQGSQSTGDQPGGSILFQVSPAGSAGLGQNGLETILEVTGSGGITGQDGTTANTLALRNGANAQAFNIYNTFTDASNYERGFMKWNSNVLEIGAEAAGSGTARSVALYAGGAQRFTIDTSGNATLSGTNNSLNCIGTTAGSVYARQGTGSGTIRTFMLAGFSAGAIGTETAHSLSIRSQNVDRIKLDTIGSVEVATALTVATLPGTPAVGMIARITDGDSGLTHGQTAVNSGAGATPYLVWYNGTNWTVIGV